MANRASDADVKAIKPTDIADLTPWIDAANEIVNDINDNCGKSLDEDRLKQIEIWLSAHFVSITDPVISKEKFENAENTYQRGNLNLSGIMSTQYGQMANTLAEGCLTEFDMRDPQVAFA